MSEVELFDRFGRRLFTIAQLADELGVTVAAVNKARQRGALRAEEAPGLDARTPLFYAPREREACAVPLELRERPQWLCWYGSARPQLPGGGAASVTTPSDWVDYDEAVAGGNVGFVLAAEPGRYDLCCIDLDDVVDDDGGVDDTVAQLLRMAGPTWVEVSPSGNGLHVWGWAEVAKGRRTTWFGQKTEVYGSARFIRMSGTTWPGSPMELADLTAVIAAVLSPSTN